MFKKVRSNKTSKVVSNAWFVVPPLNKYTNDAITIGR